MRLTSGKQHKNPTSCFCLFDSVSMAVTLFNASRLAVSAANTFALHDCSVDRSFHSQSFSKCSSRSGGKMSKVLLKKKKKRPTNLNWPFVIVRILLAILRPAGHVPEWPHPRRPAVDPFPAHVQQCTDPCRNGRCTPPTGPRSISFPTMRR